MLKLGELVSARLDVKVTGSGHYVQLDNGRGFVPMDLSIPDQTSPKAVCKQQSSCDCDWANERECLDVDAEPEEECRSECCCLLRPAAVVPSGWAIRGSTLGDWGTSLGLLSQYTTLQQCIDHCEHQVAGCRSIFFNSKFGCDFRDKLILAETAAGNDDFFKYQVNACLVTVC